MGINTHERFENHMAVSSPETVGDAERKEDIDNNDDGDEFEKRISLCGFRKTKGDWKFNTPATLNERKSHLSDNEKEEFEEQLNAGGGTSGQRGHLRGEGREYWLTSSSSKERASGRFVTDEIPGDTPEEKQENLQTPPYNKAEITERVVATKPHVAFTSRVSLQEEFAKETGYKAREGIEQTFIPTYNKEGPLKSGILEIKQENEESAESDVQVDDVEKEPTEVAEGTPNSTFEKDGLTYKTDDNGNIYMSDGKRSHDSTYELNGSVYTTDDKGRIASCEAKPQRSPENPRDNDAQRKAGGDDRKESDQGGHIIGRDLNGDGGGGNLVAMDSKINQSDYKRMENDVKNSLDEGKDVTTKTEINYDGDSERPDKITVTVTADGKDTFYKFDNNIDGSMKDEVPENGKEAVQSELDDTGGNVSSIKEEYDEDGNLSKTTVNITYTDEDGSTRRTKVVIENNLGGEN